MKPSAARIVFAFLFLGFCFWLPHLALAQDNILTNGDFSKGTQGWDGDFDNPTVEGSFMTTSPDSSGEVITLQDTHAVRVLQHFTPGTFTCYLRVKFTCSSDTAFSGAGKLLDVLNGSSESYPHNNRTFLTPVAVLASAESPDISVYPLAVNKDGKSAESDLKIDLQPHGKYRIYIAFPPGHGTVTLSSVLLSTTAPPSTLPAAPVVAPESNAAPAVPIVSPSQ